MKLACFGDRHFDAASPRLGHALAMFDWAMADAAHRGVDAFIGLGDVCEGHLQGDLAFDVGWRYARQHTVPIYEILGNHEAYKALEWLKLFNVTVASHTIQVVQLPRALLLMIPYPRRGRAPFDELGGDTIGETMDRAIARIRGWIHAFGEEARAAQIPLLVMGHWTVEGMTVNTSRFEIHEDREVVIPQAVFAPASLVVTGHIHRAQAIGRTIHGAGSLYRTAHGEETNTIGYGLVEVRDDGSCTYEHILVPARPMRTLAFEGAAIGPALQRLVVVPDEELRLQLTLDPGQDPPSPSVLDQIRRIVGHLVVEVTPRVIRRERSEAILKATTLTDEVDAWAVTTGREMPPAQQQRVHKKVSALEDGGR